MLPVVNPGLRISASSHETLFLPAREGNIINNARRKHGACPCVRGAALLQSFPTVPWQRQNLSFEKPVLSLREDFSVQSKNMPIAVNNELGFFFFLVRWAETDTHIPLGRTGKAPVHSPSSASPAPGSDHEPCLPQRSHRSRRGRGTALPLCRFCRCNFISFFKANTIFWVTIFLLSF